MSSLVYGLDVHKKSTYATILDPDGECVIQNKCPTRKCLSSSDPMKWRRC